MHAANLRWKTTNCWAAVRAAQYCSHFSLISVKTAFIFVDLDDALFSGIAIPLDSVGQC